MEQGEKNYEFFFLQGKQPNFSRASLTLKADRAGGQGFAPATTNMTPSYLKKKKKKSPIAGQFPTYQLRVPGTSVVVKKSKKFCHMPSLCNIISRSSQKWLSAIILCDP